MPYKKCPRCNLNYIDVNDTYCPVCLAELGKIKRDNTLDLSEDGYELCPECGENMIAPGEEMCAQCAMLHAAMDHEKSDDASAASDVWSDEYPDEEIPIDNEKPDGIEMVDLEDLDEEDEEEEDENDEENINYFENNEEELDLEDYEDEDDEDEEDEDDDEPPRRGRK
ncbi:MAG: hypothetical protein KIG36_03560 [Eubacteriales bacterium]|nr:hypothetical protein [Eubacteriales bacterium]